MSAADVDTVELRKFAGPNEPSAQRAGAAPSYLSEASRADDAHSYSVIEISVMLADGYAVKINVDASVTANETLDTVIEKMSLNEVEARRVLGLWLVSRSLCLQLKPKHMPYQIARKWPETLRKFTNCSVAEAEKEQPLLMLKRNIYVSREEDLSVKDVGVLTLLAAEARACVLSGDWPCTDEDTAVRLSGPLACLQFGAYDCDIHTEEHYRKHAVQLVPAKIVHNSSDKRKLFARIALEHNDVSASIYHQSGSDIEKTADLEDDFGGQLYRHFLSICCDLPYYGCVFFDAHVERAHKSLLKGKHQRVAIGVNTSGVFIIDTEKHVPLFGGLLTELTWEFIDACNCPPDSVTCPHAKGYCVKGKDAVPYILLQRKEGAVIAGNGGSSNEGSGVAESALRVLAIYTKAAKLIDALIENVMQLLGSAAVPQTPPASATEAGDVVDGGVLSGDDQQDSSAAPQSKAFVWQEKLRTSTHGCCNYGRLRAQRYSATGERLDAPAKK